MDLFICIFGAGMFAACILINDIRIDEKIKHRRDLKRINKAIKIHAA